MGLHTPSKTSFFSTLGSLASLASVLVVAASTGCGLIKINGKPLGAGASAGGDGATSASGSEERGEGSSSEVGGSDDALHPGSPLCELSYGFGGGISELQAALKTQSRERAAESLANAMCTKDGELPRDEVEEIGGAWRKANHIDARDLVANYRILKGRADLYSIPESLTGPVRDYATMDSSPSTALYLRDQLGNQASALARIGAVRACLNVRTAESPDVSKGLLRSILCSREPLDLTKAEEEIDATEGLSETTRFTLRSAAWNTTEVARKARQAVAALGKQDPGVGKLISIADEERKLWTNMTPLRGKLNAQLAAMEEAAAAHQRSAFAGCEDRTLKAWEAQLREVELPAAPEKNQVSTYAMAALATAEGYLAYAALRLCSEASETDDTHVSNDIQWRGLTRRGAYTSTLTSWFSLEGISFEDQRRKLDQLLRDSGLSYAPQILPDVEAGVISRIGDVDGGVEVTFKKVRGLRVVCKHWEQTYRIERITAEGIFIYQERCTSMGPVMMDLTGKPVKFGKAFARGLKPGMFLVAAQGLPVVATSSPSSSKPLFVLGASVR
jgi:hypothetical protein